MAKKQRKNNRKRKSTFVNPLAQKAYRTGLVNRFAKQTQVPISKERAREIADEIMPLLDFSTPADFNESVNAQSERILKREFELQSVDYDVKTQSNDNQTESDEKKDE